MQRDSLPLYAEQATWTLVNITAMHARPDGTCPRGPHAMPAERFGAARLLCRLPVPRHESGLFHRTLLRSAPEKAAMSEPRLALKNSGGSQRIVKARRTNEPDDIEMANLYPRDTGLPMTVWVSPRGRARHDARVKVCLTPADRRRLHRYRSCGDPSGAPGCQRRVAAARVCTGLPVDHRQ